MKKLITFSLKNILVVLVTFKGDLKKTMISYSLYAVSYIENNKIA